MAHNRGGTTMLTCLMYLACLSTEPSPEPGPQPPNPAGEVYHLMQAMRSGEYRGAGFPALGWQHVPALLERARSRAPVRAFPLNPLSSYIPRPVREGEVALWLVEGIRRGGRYPSLAPSLRGAGARSHEKAVHAYLRWWRLASRSPKARAQEPLKDAGLSWY
jgi:hypothetical protein